MDNVIELNPQKRTEDKIKKVIREIVEEFNHSDADQEELENIIFQLYHDWYHNAPDLKIEYNDGSLLELIRQIENFYNDIIRNLLCALAAEKFVHYKTTKDAQKNNNNKNTGRS